MSLNMKFLFFEGVPNIFLKKIVRVHVHRACKEFAQQSMHRACTEGTKRLIREHSERIARRHWVCTERAQNMHRVCSFTAYILFKSIKCRWILPEFWGLIPFQEPPDSSKGTLETNSFTTSTAKFLWAAQTKKGTAYKLMKLHASSWNCLQAHGTSCKFRELNASS